jgi:hypothetical protein
VSDLSVHIVLVFLGSLLPGAGARDENRRRALSGFGSRRAQHTGLAVFNDPEMIPWYF